MSVTIPNEIQLWHKRISRRDSRGKRQKLCTTYENEVEEGKLKREREKKRNRRYRPLSTAALTDL